MSSIKRSPCVKHQAGQHTQPAQDLNRFSVPRIEVSDYYKDSKVLLGVAAMRFAGYRLARIWTDLGKVRPPGDIDQRAWPALGDKPPKFGDILQYAQPGPRPSDQLLRIAEATGYAAILHKFFSQGSALPARLSEVSGAAKPDDIRMMSALLYHLQVMLIVLGLWQNVPTVWKVVDQVPGITKTLTGGDLGGKWTVATYKLEDEFNKELAIENWRHPNSWPTAGRCSRRSARAPA